MLEALVGIVIALTIALVIVFLIAVTRGWVGAGGIASLQQQLFELRSRLDDLVASQREVPRVLAEGTAVQAKSLAHVREQLSQLADTTVRLETVGRSVAEVQELLKVPKLRGTLGEVWLEELLRQVLPSELYEMQHAFRSGETVDAVIAVGERLVPIDSKFPLEACQRMLAADGDEAERERRAFRQTLRRRIDEVADKYIRPDEGTYDFALMYIPAENVYYEGVVGDGSSTVDYALRRQVVPVSPNTFYAYLAAILHGLRGLRVEERAQEIRDGLSELQQQVARFRRTYEVAGKHLDNAAKQFGASDKQLEGIRDQLEKITAPGPRSVEHLISGNDDPAGSC